MSVAADVADALDLDEVLWVVARRSPHKPDASPAPDEVRLRMVRAATAADRRFEPCALELERPPPSYTVDTLRELRRERGDDAELFLIVGIDQFRAFDDWRQPGAILELATLAVMDRGGEGLEEDRAWPDQDRASGVQDRASGVQDRASGEGKRTSDEQDRVSGNTEALRVPVDRVDISSTRVREAVARGESIAELVPPAVARIIEAEGLYR